MKLTKRTSGIALAVAMLLTTAMPVVSAQSGVNERSIQGTWRTVSRRITVKRVIRSLRLQANSRSIRAAQWRSMELVLVRVRPCGAPGMGSGSAGKAGSCTRSLSRSIATTRAASCSDRQRVTGNLELGGSGDAFTTRSAIEILDVNDVVVGSGCATAAGTRFD